MASTIMAPPAIETFRRLERMGAASGSVRSVVGAGEAFGIAAGVVARVRALVEATVAVRLDMVNGPPQLGQKLASPGMGWLQ
jgi:hypothetical protein